MESATEPKPSALLRDDALVVLIRRCLDLQVDYPDVWENWSNFKIRFVWLHRQDREEKRERRRIEGIALAMRAAGDQSEKAEHWTRFMKSLED